RAREQGLRVVRADPGRHLRRRERRQGRRARCWLWRYRVPRRRPCPQREEGRLLRPHCAIARDRPGRQLPTFPLPLLLYGRSAEGDGEEVRRLGHERCRPEGHRRSRLLPAAEEVMAVSEAAKHQKGSPFARRRRWGEQVLEAVIRIVALVSIATILLILV